MVCSPLLHSWRRAPFILVAVLLMVGGARAESPRESTESKPGNPSALHGVGSEAGHTSSPWMSLSEMNAYLEGLDGDKSGGKNYWDRGHWIDAAEGRWEAGIPQYRLTHSAVPENRAYWWNWYFNQDREAFDGMVHRMADEGYALVQFNSFVRPGGSERFQGVWHKLIPVTDEPLLPAGHYRLSEIHRRSSIPSPVSLVIEGDRISGRGPWNEFKGSVRCRYSGTIKITPVANPTGGAIEAANFESEFLKLLENATWKEDGNKIRVVKDGETVLRFERDETNGEK